MAQQLGSLPVSHKVGIPFPLLAPTWIPLGKGEFSGTIPKLLPWVWYRCVQHSPSKEELELKRLWNSVCVYVCVCVCVNPQVIVLHKFENYLYYRAAKEVLWL
jgi:hypothetical protein